MAFPCWKWAIQEIETCFWRKFLQGLDARGGDEVDLAPRYVKTVKIQHDLASNELHHTESYYIFFFMFLCFVSCQGFCSSSFSAPKFEPWSNWGETKGIERVRCTAGPAGVHEPV